VSDDWLRDKAGAEKGFSLGFFDRDYMARFPVAVLERQGRVLAFANLWPGPQNAELSIDLMRFHRDAPASAMEALLVHVMLWGKQRGYRSFALGMAPLSGFESSPVAPIWNRLGGLLYRRGGVFYNFQGLRAYIQGEVQPGMGVAYLAYPGGLHLPMVMADIAALVAGGYRGIFLNRGRRPISDD
jgi:phosphatidylglycerol lysyltransferase